MQHPRRNEDTLGHLEAVLLARTTADAGVCLRKHGNEDVDEHHIRDEHVKPEKRLRAGRVGLARSALTEPSWMSYFDAVVWCGIPHRSSPRVPTASCATSRAPRECFLRRCQQLRIVHRTESVFADPEHVVQEQMGFPPPQWFTLAAEPPRASRKAADLSRTEERSICAMMPFLCGVYGRGQRDSVEMDPASVETG